MKTRKKTRIEDHSTHTERSKGNTPLKEKGYYSHCSKDGHHEATYWAFHPYLHPERNKKVRQTPLRETSNQAVMQENPQLERNQLPRKRKLGKEDMFDVMTEKMGKILELVKSNHLFQSHDVIQTP